MTAKKEILNKIPISHIIEKNVETFMTKKIIVNFIMITMILIIKNILHLIVKTIEMTNMKKTISMIGIIKIVNQ